MADLRRRLRTGSYEIDFEALAERLMDAGIMGQPPVEMPSGRRD